MRSDRRVILDVWIERIATLPAAPGASLVTRGTSVLEWLAASLAEENQSRPLAQEVPFDESFSAPRTIAELTLLAETIAGLRPTRQDNTGRDALHQIIDRAIADSLARDSDEAARLRKRLNLASHVTLVGSWQFDPVSGVVETDARARELFSVLDDDAPTLDALTSRLHEDDREEVRAGILQTLASQQSYKVECRTLRAVAGSLRWIAIATEAHAGLGAKNPIVLGIVHDITASKRAEEEHARLVEELSRAVHISEMFVGILSHDLRTPLNAILGGAQLLGLGATDARSLRALAIMRSSGDRMVRMIDQLLDFTRARLGEGIPLRPESVDLAQVARDVVEEIKSASSSSALRLEVIGDPVGVWDRDRLAQILSNLVGNAVAHAAAGGYIDVVVDGSDPDRVILSTLNNGAIPKHVLPVIFNPFRGTIQKLGASSGLGLGLYIARQIALAHGGELSVETTETTTSFKLVLPRKDQRRAPARHDLVREEELAAFERLASPPSLNNVTARMFGATPLDESAPVQHAEMVARYEAFLETALQRKAYRGQGERLSEEVRALAERLGDLNAGPRDVTDVHARALRGVLRGATAAKTQAMLAEGRLLALELMGHLASYYRRRSRGTVSTPEGSAK